MLRADLTEEQLASIHKDQTGAVSFPAFPGKTAEATVMSINYIPLQADKFDCQLSARSLPDHLMPGMKCKIRFIVRQDVAAITVPETSVFTDDGFKYFVYVLGDDGTPTQQKVSVGLTANKKTEILDGLEPGDKVLLERPAH